MNGINLSQIINLKISRTKEGIEISQVTILAKPNVKEIKWMARRNGKSSGLHSSRAQAIAAL
jgi:hypothetical protein